MFETPVEHPTVSVLQNPHHRIPPFLDFPVAENEVAEHRRNQKREYQRAQQCECYSPGHRTEQAAFDALQREDRQIGNDDNDARKKYRLLHFVRGGSDYLEKSLLLLRICRVAHDIFHHDHRPVDDHSEVERSERKQIRRDVIEIKKNRRKEQRERNRDRDNQRAPNVPEKIKRTSVTRITPSRRFRKTVCVV